MAQGVRLLNARIWMMRVSSTKSTCLFYHIHGTAPSTLSILDRVPYDASCPCKRRRGAGRTNLRHDSCPQPSTVRRGVTSCCTGSTAKVSMLNAAPHWSACGTVCLIVHAAALRHRTLPDACRPALMRVRHRTPPEACRPALRRGVGAGRTQARAA